MELKEKSELRVPITTIKIESRKHLS